MPVRRRGRIDVGRTVACALSTLWLWFGAGDAVALPVTDGLTVWLRAADLALADGADVELWEDRSGHGNHATYDPANAYGELAPLYDASNPWVGGRPTVRFEDENALALDLQFLAGSDYTVIAVNGREGTGVANFFLAGDTRSADENLVLGYERPHRLRLAHFSNDLDAVVESVVADPVYSLDSFLFTQSQGRWIFHNGEIVAADGNLQPLQSNTGTTLGNFRAFGDRYFFHGDLAEVVIYDRALSHDELALVEEELAAIYGLPLALPEPGPAWLLGGLAGLQLARSSSRSAGSRASKRKA